MLPDRQEFCQIVLDVWDYLYYIEIRTCPYNRIHGAKQRLLSEIWKAISDKLYTIYSMQF